MPRKGKTTRRVDRRKLQIIGLLAAGASIERIARICRVSPMAIHQNLVRITCDIDELDHPPGWVYELQDLIDAQLRVSSPHAHRYRLLQRLVHILYAPVAQSKSSCFVNSRPSVQFRPGAPSKDTSSDKKKERPML